MSPAARAHVIILLTAIITHPLTTLCFHIEAARLLCIATETPDQARSPFTEDTVRFIAPAEDAETAQKQDTGLKSAFFIPPGHTFSMHATIYNNSRCTHTLPALP